MERRHTPLVAMLTDFGLEDAYVGVMKSVIAGQCPGCGFLDLSHAVSPQNVRQAAYLLWTAYKYIPDGAVTLCVVDPGVGTERRPIAVQWSRGWFVGPDNGWLTLVARDARAEEWSGNETLAPTGWTVVELAPSKYWLSPVSATFHGRDIFSPVAAALCTGVPIEELGEKRETLTVFPTARSESDNGTVRGRVIHVDHFGNLITDIAAAHLPDRFSVSLAGGAIDGPARSYQLPEPLVALVGSSGLLEIAAPNASAAKLITVGVGEPVTVAPKRSQGMDTAA